MALDQLSANEQCDSCAELAELLERRTEELTFLLYEEHFRAKESEKQLRREVNVLRKTLVKCDQDMHQCYMDMQQHHQWFSEELQLMKNKYMSVDENYKHMHSVWTDMEDKKTQAQERLQREIKKKIALRVKIQHMKERAEKQEDKEDKEAQEDKEEGRGQDQQRRPQTPKQSICGGDGK